MSATNNCSVRVELHKTSVDQGGQHTVNPRYNDSICSQKMCYYNEFAVLIKSSMDRMICNKGLVLFLFPHRTYVLDVCLNRLSEGILINIQNICCL